jgi:CRISPR/Cas system-associated exonuclease Cas4 (RecB family)
MWKINPKIGFNDTPVTVVMVPILAFIIPYIFTGARFDRPPYFTWKVYLGVLLITAVVWIGNRFIMILMRTRFPQFNRVKRRLWIQSVAMLIFSLLAANILAYALDICNMRGPGRYPNLDYAAIILNTNVANLFCTLTVVAIYETVYFMSELRKSVEEKELLKRESLNAHLNALKSQVNPHFLFNNLNTLIAVIPENPSQAIDFVQQLSKVYRHILEVKDEQSIFLKDELEVMQAYAFLLETRFGKNIDIRVDIPAEKLKRRIVPLSLQILMENAVKHNIVSSEKPLRILVYSQNGRLIVTNNLQKKNQINESTGIGLDNIRNRYRLLSSKQVEVIENISDFTVSIPLIEN